ncbi:MAG: beta-galactosidase, partial [Verrucomicrobiota bacterium]|nr:beta-galactosidase [Verrucomicrobiota bacterium]
MRHWSHVWVCCLGAVLGGFAKDEIPHLVRTGDATRLIVDGKPFIMIAGEVHNSSMSAPGYLTRVFEKAAKLRVNTVLAPVAWEQFEPEEGRFDSTLIDRMIREARAHRLRLVVLWFGSWKNGSSSYAPEWVKRDTARFPRALGSSNRNVKDILSTFSTAGRDADARAFAALMRHIRKVDARHTVITVQVENEMGIRPEFRDQSEVADAAYRQPVPAELMAYLADHRATLHPALLQRWEAGGFRAA